MPSAWPVSRPRLTASSENLIATGALAKICFRIASARGLGVDGRDVGGLAGSRARDERFVTRSGDDDAAHRGVIARVLERRPQVLPRSLIQRVQHLGAIERHIGDPFLLLVQDVLERWSI